MNGWEQYRLVLYHEYVTENGERLRMSEPVVVTLNIGDSERIVPTPMVINRMLDKLSHYLIEMVAAYE